MFLHHLIISKLTVIFVHFLDDLILQLTDVQAQVLFHFHVRVFLQRKQLFEKFSVRENVG